MRSFVRFVSHGDLLFWYSSTHRTSTCCVQVDAQCVSLRKERSTSSTEPPQLDACFLTEEIVVLSTKPKVCFIVRSISENAGRCCSFRCDKS